MCHNNAYFVTFVNWCNVKHYLLRSYKIHDQTQMYDLINESKVIGQSGPRIQYMNVDMCNKWILHRTLTRYVKLRVAHAPGMPGTFSPPPLVSDTGMHHGTCVTHVPWCTSGSLTPGGGENVPGIPAHAQPAILRTWQEAHWRLHSKVMLPIWCVSQSRCLGHYLCVESHKLINYS